MLSNTHDMWFQRFDCKYYAFCHFPISHEPLPLKCSYWSQYSGAIQGKDHNYGNVYRPICCLRYILWNHVYGCPGIIYDYIISQLYFPRCPLIFLIFFCKAPFKRISQVLSEHNFLYILRHNWCWHYWLTWNLPDVSSIKSLFPLQYFTHIYYFKEK